MVWRFAFWVVVSGWFAFGVSGWVVWGWVFVCWCVVFDVLFCYGCCGIVLLCLACVVVVYGLVVLAFWCGFV